MSYPTKCSAAAICYFLGFWSNQGLADPPREPMSGLAARQDIAPLTRLDEPGKLFKEVRLPRGEKPGEAIRDLAQLRGKVLLHRLSRGKFVKDRDVVALQAHERALPIQLGGPRGPFFIRRGQRVDVIQTKHTGGNQEFVAVVLLRDLEVIDPGPLDGDRVVLKVDAEQARTIQGAMNQGVFTLLLRGVQREKR